MGFIKPTYNWGGTTLYPPVIKWGKKDMPPLEFVRFSQLKASTSLPVHCPLKPSIYPAVIKHGLLEN